jgi:hypothetical protein
VPAVIVGQTDRGRSELSSVITGALHTDRVVLADDALAVTPSIAIGRTPLRDERGLLLNGREIAKPEIFQLYLVRRGCLLVHPKSGRAWVLRDVKCRAAVGPSG